MRWRNQLLWAKLGGSPPTTIAIAVVCGLGGAAALEPQDGRISG
jgi:hypothetical protein